MGPGVFRFRNSLLLIACSAALGAQAQDAEEDLLFKSAHAVNEGQLRFLHPLPDKPLYHLHNRLVISPTSVADGWVGITQCHEHLDAVPSLQIVYSADRIRKLEILSSQNIGRAWVEAASVQIQDLRPGASVCVGAESRALQRDESGTSLILNSGPYMRRFLDGYYPMRASLKVRLETDKLLFTGIEPAVQPGFSFWQEDGELGYEAHFEGMLRTALRFRLAH